MPALNFKKEFAEKVKHGLEAYTREARAGSKRQTIRALRKDGRNPRSLFRCWLRLRCC